MLPSRSPREVLARAEELGLSLRSPAEELTQRLAQDDAVLETLRSLDPALVDHDPTRGRAALSVRDPAPTRTTRPPLFWRGEQPDPPAPATVADRRGPTWISVVDDPRVSPGGPLTGWEVGVKDLMAVEGCELTAGTRAHQGRTAAADAPAVAALRSAGATIRGTVNLHALAYGATGTSSDWGVPTNPAVAGAIPGGSSSGSAAAVAEGTAALALGTDTSGSIRIPAALCGVVGLKPTRGLVSTQGCHPLSPTLDHIGPLGASVRPVAAAMSALAGWSGWRLPEEPEGTIRVGVLGGYFAEGVTAPVATAFAHACEQLERHGVELVPVELPLARHVPGAQIALLGTEALESNLETLRARGGLLPADVRLRLEAGLARTPEQYAVSRALAARLRVQVDTALELCHALICPTTAITAPSPDTSHVEVDGAQVTVQFSLTRLTMPFNFSGHPALTLPLRDGWREDGAGEAGPGAREGERARVAAPVGLQVIGRSGADQDLLALSAHLEQILT